MENYEPLHPPKRLDSWKEIATHLGRTVRTVQRWEHDLGLPVHRVAGLKRDMVHAFADELDAWAEGRGSHALAQRESDSGEVPLLGDDHQNPPSLEVKALHYVSGNGNSHGNPQTLPVTATIPDGQAPGMSASNRPAVSWQRRAAAVVALLALGALGVLLMQKSITKVRAWFSPPAPASYKLEGQQVKVYDARGNFLWQHDFGTRLELAGYEANRKSLDIPYVGLHDLNGDGRKELLFALKSAGTDWDPTTFFCFNSDGSIRFTRQRDKTMRFGEIEYRPPFVPRGFLVTPEADGTKTVWLSILHTPEFPEVLEKLNHRGEVLGEFWHGGHLHALTEGKYWGKRVIFAGYFENDQRRASMAVLDYDHPTGFAPAQDRYYLCATCPAGRPLEFFIFPRLDLSRTVNSMPGVDHIFVSPQGEPLVHVRQTIELPQHGQRETGVQYKLDAGLNFVDAFHDSSYGEVHAQLEMRGGIKHRYARSEEIELFPVLRWDGSRFVQVHAPAQFLTARTPAARKPRALPSPALASAPALSARTPRAPRLTQPE